MNRNRTILRTTSLLAFLLLIVLAGCGGSSGDKSEKPRIAVTISTLNNPWFVVLGETARDRAVELGYEATLFDSQNDTAKEAAHFDNVIAAGYSAVLFNPTDADGSIASVKRAKEAGLPVFCIDREINSTDLRRPKIRWKCLAFSNWCFPWAITRRTSPKRSSWLITWRFPGTPRAMAP